MVNRTKKNLDSDALVVALMDQVSKAANGESEQTVMTLITVPMWREFLRATNTPVNSKPTKWLGAKDTIRVCGSCTVLVPQERWASVSFSMIRD